MQGLFNYELDGRYPLRRIPMIMRFNLDACGIRVPFEAWVLLTREQRELLVATPCTTDAEKQMYRTRIQSMMAEHADKPDAAIELVDVEKHPAWRDVSAVPTQVVEQLNELSLPIPNVAQWQGLLDLQRFALIKLTRSGHKNANLLPALQEFGLA